MASEKGDTDNAMLNGKAVQRGFNRTAFSEKAEQAFDRFFDYKRSINQSFSYLNTMKHGSVHEQAEMRKKELKQNHEQKKEQALRKDQNILKKAPTLEEHQKPKERNRSGGGLSI